ncbi:MAG: hypothetical protein N3A66_11415 [Planctomycetota bacterium]|nr:hypothetical protein [Planctomycetota bacterium]
MATAWGQMGGAEAADRGLAAAIACQAREVNISCDGEGAAIFFLSPQGIEFFDHIPRRCCEAVRDYLKAQAGIDLWQPPPACGLAAFCQREKQYNLEVRTAASSNGEDMVVRISPC